MNKILLVRHGQASFGQSNYDQLSAMGQQQAQLLGQQWQQQNIKPSLWICGDLQRQVDSMHNIRSVMDEENEQHISLKELNEFPAETITKHYLPQVVAAENNPMLNQDLIFSDNLIFQRLFSKVIRCWIEEERPEKNNFESWPAYQKRVEQGISSLISTVDSLEDSKQTIVVVTSAGFIAATACYLISSINSEMFKLAWNLVNSSVSEIHYNHARLFLHSFNNYSHLTNKPELITYR